MFTIFSLLGGLALDPGQLVAARAARSRAFALFAAVLDDAA